MDGGSPVGTADEQRTNEQTITSQKNKCRDRLVDG